MRSKASPGSIFTRKGSASLYIKVGGECISTGLPDTQENRKLCEKKMKAMHLRQLGMNYNERKRAPRLYDAIEHFRKDHLFNKAQATITTYNYAIERVAVRNVEINRDNVSDQVKDYIMHATVQLASVEIVLRHYQTFVNWLYRNDYLDKPLNIKRFMTKKAGKKKVKIYSEAEIHIMIEYWTERDKEFALMIRFMLATGGRIGETLRLEWKDIDDKWIYFNNKYDSAPELFPIYSDLSEILGEIGRKEGKLFRWSANTVSRLHKRFNEAFEEMKLDRDERSFHELRKTFRMRLFDNKVPLEIASQLLRHRTINVTMKHYTEYKRENLQEHLEKKGEKTAPTVHQIYNLLSEFMKRNDAL